MEKFSLCSMHELACVYAHLCVCKWARLHQDEFQLLKDDVFVKAAINYDENFRGNLMFQ